MNLQASIDLYAFDSDEERDTHGRWTSGNDSDLSLLPKDIKINSLTVNDLISQDRWKLTAKPGAYDDHYTITIAPKMTPTTQEFKGNRGPVYADTEIATFKLEDGYPRATLKPDSGYVQYDPDNPPANPNNDIYRGISHEEMQSIKNTGFVKSNATYNLGPGQADLTYFTADFSQAHSYAGSFQPYPMSPTFGKPGYVISVKRPPDSQIDTTEAPKGELGVKGKISAKDITGIYELRPYYIKPGEVDLIPRGYGSKLYTDGSRSSQSVSTGLKKLDTSVINK